MGHLWLASLNFVGLLCRLAHSPRVSALQTSKSDLLVGIARHDEHMHDNVEQCDATVVKS